MKFFSMALGEGQGRISGDLARKIRISCKGQPQYDDLWLPARCKMTPFEMMFLKTNRGIDFKDLARCEL